MDPSKVHIHMQFNSQYSNCSHIPSIIVKLFVVIFKQKETMKELYYKQNMI
jgi:hypothetical protein